MTSATRTTVVAKIVGMAGGDYTLKVKSDGNNSFALDEQRAPYGTMKIDVALPASSITELVTPYASLRLQGTISHEWETPVRAPQTRTFDLLLHERTIDHETATLTLTGVTDEALFIDRRNSSSTLARTYGLSLKTAVDYALTSIGASLAAGYVDATLTAKTPDAVLTNGIQNPTGGASSITGWTTGLSASGGIATLAATIPGVSHQGRVIRSTMAAGESYGLYLSGSAGGSASVTVAGLPAVTPGKKYVDAIYLRPSVTKTIRLYARTVNAAGTLLTQTVGVQMVCPAGVWTRLSVTFTADATAAAVALLVDVTVNWNAADTLDFGAAMHTEGSVPVTYFDGAGSNRDAGLYTAAWTGTANASASTLTPIASTDATIWRPGQSLDDWLAPMLQASNRRLFCDEKRVWRLVDSSYTVDGLVTVSEGTNALTGTDIMSRQYSEQGVPSWFDHVIVHYKWTDTAGVTQEAWDFSSTGTVKGFLVEKTTPYPGPGAATGILARAAGRGRQQLVSVLTDYTATPGMAIVTTLPGTPIQTGVTSAVKWIWSETTDEMTVTSRGLISTPANAWLFALGAWSAATGTWAAATGTN